MVLTGDDGRLGIAPPPFSARPSATNFEVRVRVLGLAGIVVDRQQCCDVSGRQNSPLPPSAFGAIVSFGKQGQLPECRTVASTALRRSRAEDVRGQDNETVLSDGTEDRLERHIALWPQSSASQGSEIILSCSMTNKESEQMFDVQIGLTELGDNKDEIVAIGISKLLVNADQARSPRIVTDLPVISIHSDPPGQYTSVVMEAEERKKRKGFRLFKVSKHSEEKKEESSAGMESVYGINSSDAAMRVEIEVIEKRNQLLRQSTHDYNGPCPVPPFFNAMDPTTVSAVTSKQFSMKAAFPGFTIEKDIPVLLSPEGNLEPSIERVLTKQTLEYKVAGMMEQFDSFNVNMKPTNSESLLSGPNPTQNQTKACASEKLVPTRSGRSLTPSVTPKLKECAEFESVATLEQTTTPPLAGQAMVRDPSFQQEIKPKFAVDQESGEDDEASTFFSVKAGDSFGCNQPVEVLPKERIASATPLRSNQRNLQRSPLKSVTPMRRRQVAAKSSRSPKVLGNGGTIYSGTSRSATPVRPALAPKEGIRPTAAAEKVSSKAQILAARHDAGKVMPAKKGAASAEPVTPVRIAKRAARKWSPKKSQKREEAIATPDTSTETPTPQTPPKVKNIVRSRSDRQVFTKSGSMAVDLDEEQSVFEKRTSVLSRTRKDASRQIKVFETLPTRGTDVIRSQSFDSSTKDSTKAKTTTERESSLLHFFLPAWSTNKDEASQPLALCYANGGTATEGDDESYWTGFDDENSSMLSGDRDKTLANEAVKKVSYSLCQPLEASAVGPEDLLKEVKLIQAEFRQGKFWRAQSIITHQTGVSGATQETGALSRRKSRWSKRVNSLLSNETSGFGSTYESDGDDDATKSLDENSAQFTNDATEDDEESRFFEESFTSLNRGRHVMDGNISRDTTVKIGIAKLDGCNRRSQSSTEAESTSHSAAEDGEKAAMPKPRQRSLRPLSKNSSKVNNSESVKKLSSTDFKGSISDALMNVIRCRTHMPGEDDLKYAAAEDEGDWGAIGQVPSRLDPVDDNSIGELTQTTYEVQVNAKDLKRKLDQAKHKPIKSGIGEGKDIGGFFRCGNDTDTMSLSPKAAGHVDSEYFNEYDDYSFMSPEMAAAAEAAWSKRRAEVTNADPMTGRVALIKSGRTEQSHHQSLEVVHSAHTAVRIERIEV